MIETEKRPVEYTAKYSQVVDSVQEAFEFVMSHLDKVGPEPSVWIDPAWEHDHEEMTGNVISRSVFVVVVSGSVPV